MKKIIACLVLAVVLSTRAWADVKPNALFSDNAVLQRGQPVPVWGTAAPAERVNLWNRAGLPASPIRTDPEALKQETLSQ